MEPIRILIADDDPGMRTVMRLLVERSEGYSLVGEAADGDELLKLYDQTQPQVILMDVEMPGLSGIECARIIQDRDPRTVLVFATAHEEYMRSAFEVYAFDYLVKPFRTERALGTLKLIRGRLTAQSAPAETPKPVSSNASGRMMLKHRDGLSFLNFADILLVQREDRASAHLHLRRRALSSPATHFPKLKRACRRKCFSAPTRAISSISTESTPYRPTDDGHTS